MGRCSLKKNLHESAVFTYNLLKHICLSKRVLTEVFDEVLEQNCVL